MFTKILFVFKIELSAVQMYIHFQGHPVWVGPTENWQLSLCLFRDLSSPVSGGELQRWWGPTCARRWQRCLLTFTSMFPWLPRQNHWVKYFLGGNVDISERTGWDREGVLLTHEQSAASVTRAPVTTRATSCRVWKAVTFQCPACPGVGCLLESVISLGTNRIFCLFTR